MNKPRKRILLKSLSSERQELIVCMHEKQFGTIRKLPISGGEPVLKKAKITKRRNLTKQSTAKPVSRNFILKSAHHLLLEALDDVADGMLELITFRDGLPCELEHCEV